MGNKMQIKMDSVKFNKEQFDKYGFEYPTDSSFKNNGHKFVVQEIILTDVVGTWDSCVLTECILGMVVISDGRTQSPVSLYWSTKTGNCGTHSYKLNKRVT